MRERLREMPWVGLSISLVLVVAPIPTWGYLVVPFAATTRDPDAIEFFSFLLIPVLMFIGAVVGVAALRDWKVNAEDQRPGILQ